MKKLTLLILLISILFSCAPKLYLNNKGVDSLLGKINKEIESRKISKDAIIYLNDKAITTEELEKLNFFELKDFTEITFLDKKQGKIKLGKTGKNGVINITSFLDPKLNYQYYKSIKNKEILNLIDKLLADGAINRNPLFVVSGKPLRGEEIASVINNLKLDKASVLKPDSAYQIYGIRAINGVILIDPKY